MTVLVIENDVAVREDVVEILRERGYEVESAVHGVEALVRIRAGARPEAILVDLYAPVMSGWDLVAALREDAVTATLPVIVMSGDPEVARHATDLGAAGCLRKPFGIPQLLAAIAPHVAAPSAPE